MFRRCVAAIVLAGLPPVLAQSFGNWKFGEPKSGFTRASGISPVFSASFSTSATPEKGPSATFTRATASTKCVDGTVSSVSSGSAVIGQPVASGGTCSGESGVYVGAAATFVALNNEALTVANGWADYNTPLRVQDVSVAPDGTTTADSIEDDSGTTAEAAARTVSVTADSSTWTATVWVRCPSTTQTVRLVLELGTGSTNTEHTCSTTWTRLVASKANNGADTTAIVYLAPAGTPTGDTGLAHFWRPQLYNKSFPLPLDPAVAGSAVTVNADALSYTFDLENKGTVCAWARPPIASAQRDIVRGVDSGARVLYPVYIATTGRASSFPNGAGPTTTASISGTAWNWLCGSWDAATTESIVSLGTEHVSANVANSANLTTVSTFYVGSNSGSTEQMNGFISRLRIYGKALTSAQRDALYNADSSLYALAPSNAPRQMLARMGLDWVADGFGFPTDAEVVALARYRVATDPDLQPAWTMEGAR